MTLRHPKRGRPRDVLLFIDFVLEPDRPVVMNLNGGVAEVYRMLPVVMAGRWAAQARLDYASAKVDAMQKIEQGMAALAGLCV